jgi:hypothetical protein
VLAGDVLVPESLVCGTTSSGEGLLEYTLSNPFNDGLGPSEMPTLTAVGLADPACEVALNITCSDR